MYEANVLMHVQFTSDDGDSQKILHKKRGQGITVEACFSKPECPMRNLGFSLQASTQSHHQT